MSGVVDVAAPVFPVTDPVSGATLIVLPAVAPAAAGLRYAYSGQRASGAIAYHPRRISAPVPLVLGSPLYVPRVLGVSTPPAPDVREYVPND